MRLLVQGKQREVLQDCCCLDRDSTKLALHLIHKVPVFCWPRDPVVLSIPCMFYR